MDPQVLIAAADDDLRASLRDLLASHPLEVTAPRPLDFLTRLACSSVRVLILVLTAGGGLDLLDAARERRPDVPVLVLRANATVAEATEAMRDLERARDDARKAERAARRPPWRSAEPRLRMLSWNSSGGTILEHRERRRGYDNDPGRDVSGIPDPDNQHDMDLL